MTKKAAVFGWWYNQNYGSILTYYALNKYIQDKGYDTILIDGPDGYKNRSKFRTWMPLAYDFFKAQGMSYTEQPHRSTMRELNNLDSVDTFILGSDQMWNPWNGWVDWDDFFDWVQPNKKSIAYSVSLGKDDRSKYDPDWVANRRRDISKFDAISMREDFSVDIMKDIFEEDVPRVLDPTYILDKSYYHDLADKSSQDYAGETYIATFFLDPNEDKARIAKAIAKKLGIKLLIIPNPLNGMEKSNKFFNPEQFNYLSEAVPQSFLNAYHNASYVITDSFHGTVFATIFEKPFSVFYNAMRGLARFGAVMDLFEFNESDRRITEEMTDEAILANESINLAVDYVTTRDKVQSEIVRSREWLDQALEKQHDIDEHEVYDEFRTFLTSRQFNFYRQGEEYPISNDIIFSENGTIKNTNSNETYWSLLDNKLLLKDTNYKTTTEFNLADLSENTTMLKGQYVENPLVIHELHISFGKNIDTGETTEEEEKFLLSRKFEFGFFKGDRILTKDWKFVNGGSISGYDNPNERIWKIINHELKIFSEFNVLTATYPLKKGWKKRLIGHDMNGIDTFFLKVRKPYDIIQAKILVSALKMEGVKHIVASSGSRDVSILRLIEENSDVFKVYPMGDERSAAYFAHGLSTEIKEPVALVCTSGTAASNYLPGVTEAYYSNTPLIVITADRHPMFLNNRDDQTIPQARMFDGVVKKEVSLLAGEHPRFEWFTEKEIKSTIMEATKGNPGPVHINIPILTFEGTAPIDEDFKLLNLQKVKRVTPISSDNEWTAYYNVLKNSDRIAILMGQNQKLTLSQKQKIYDFARKFNVIILTEHIANIQGEHVLNPYRMLNNINQSTFNDKLRPEILITVGGTQIMNHPITGKLRGTYGTRHWLVEPSGQYFDKFYHLTSIIESTQDYFFDRMNSFDDNIKNNEKYFKSWEFEVNKYPLWSGAIDRYEQLHLEGKLVTQLPKNSTLHLGVGNTFMMTQNFAIDPSIEVNVNMGTNGIDGSVSTFMGQLSGMNNDKEAFLLIGDLSFFYDMNGVWNKPMTRNLHIMLINNGKAGLLEYHQVNSTTQPFSTKAEGWVKDLGFDYLSSHDMKEFNKNLEVFLSKSNDKPIFFEVFI